MPGIRRRVATILIFIFFILVMSVSAADIKFAGYVHAWFSFADQEKDDSSVYGFTLRRVRFKPSGYLLKSIQWGLHFGWDNQTARLIEVYIDFHLSKIFNIKIGQFPVPGAVSGTLTPTTKLDFVERAAVTEHWGVNSALSGHRGLGIQVHGNLLNDKLYYAVMMANPNTSSLFSPGIKSPGYSHEDNGVALWGRVEVNLIKGFKIGTFYNEGKTTDSNYKRSSYGAHLFYIKEPLNFKLEFIAGENGIEGAETKYNGMYTVLGYKIDKFESLVRYGLYTPNDGSPDSTGIEIYKNITLGMNYYHSNKIKFQVNYVFRRENGIELKNNLFYINLQYTF